jgi:hypothetical protein
MNPSRDISQRLCHKPGLYYKASSYADRWQNAGMDTAAWATTAAAVIALIALFFTAMSAISARSGARTAKEQTKIQQQAARTAEEQTEIQRQLRVEAAQPYVWADLRPDESVGVILNLVVGNSGPTVAQNVRIKVDPPLPAIDQLAERADTAQATLARGMQSLAPGRSLAWPLGQGFNLLNGEYPQAYTFTVSADGPFGPVPELTYVVDMSDWRGITDRPAGSLHLLTEAVKDLPNQVGSRGSE